MKLFTCDNCQQTLYFENNGCVNCGETLGYIPESAALVTLRNRVADLQGVFDVDLPNQPRRRYRQCRNAREHDACNWLVPADTARISALPARLSEVIPDLSDPTTTWRGAASKRPSAACSTRCSRSNCPWCRAPGTETSASRSVS